MFVVLLRYLKPLEEVEKHVVAHRAYLDDCYRAGKLLASGPQVPRTGGVILTKKMSREALQALIEKDPFYLEGVAEYQPIAFDPVKYAKGLETFLG